MASDERHTHHPVTVAAKHSSFLAKARRLNRTKLFVVDDKVKLSENVKREEFNVLVKEELGGDADEQAVSDLREKFEKQQLRTRRKVRTMSQQNTRKRTCIYINPNVRATRRHRRSRPQVESKGRLGTGERDEYASLARRVAERNEWKQATPLDRTVKDARKLMDKTSHYDDVKMMDRKTMDSRAASIGIVYGENGKLNIEDQMKSANFSSPLYMGFANSAKSDTADRRRDAREHLGDIGEALGFSTGDIINPSQMELRDTFDGVFGMSQEEAQNEVRSEQRTQPSSEIFSPSHFRSCCSRRPWRPQIERPGTATTRFPTTTRVTTQTQIFTMR
jgi:hypothetical protein